MNLQDGLNLCSLALLRQIASAHAVQLPDPPARVEVVRVLLDRLTDPGYLAQYLQDLEPVQTAALCLVAADVGQIRGFVLERRLRQKAGPETDESAVRAILTGLLERGILFRAFQAVGPERGEIYVLPTELLPLFPSDPGTPSTELSAAGSPRETRACSSVFSLFAMGSFIRRWRQRQSSGSASEGQLGALARETADLTEEIPGRTPRERWTLLAHLALQLGLFTREEGGLHPTERLHDWLQRGEAAERRLWECYVAAEHWNDLERAGSGGGRFAGRTVEPATARAQVLDLVRSLPAAEWLLFSDVSRLVRESAPDFLREGFEVATSRLVDLESGEVLGGTGSWERVEGSMVAYMLGGPLFWLGVVEWGQVDGEWDRFRITPTGRVWLEGGDYVLQSTSAPMKLTEERRIVVSERCDLQLLWELEPYLVLEKRGPPSHYVLNRSSFARGLESGGSTTELRRLLERAVGGPPPLGFTLALERWGAKAGRFRLRPMVVLTAEGEDELSAVLDRSEVSGMIRERLGPRSVGITAARAIDLADALERMGHLPDVDASLRFMAGRRAYPAMVDQQTLESLLFLLRLIKSLKPELVGEIPHADRLAQRLEQALGPIAAPRLTRRARSLGRKLRREMSNRSAPSKDDEIAGSSEEML
jgi:hypothetical protein